MFAYLLSIARLDRNVLLYIAAFSSVGFGYIGVTSVLGNLYVLGLGFDATFLGTLTAIGQLVWALTALPAGEIGARFGLRRTVVAGYVLIALCFAAYINVPLLPPGAWGAGLLASTVLMWASVSLASVNGVPFMMSVCPAEQRSKAFSLQAAVMPLAAFLGSLVGGFLPGFLLGASAGGLDETGAYRAVLALPVLGYAAAAGFMLKARPAPPLIQSAQEAARHGAPLGLLVFLGGLFTLQLAGEASLMSFLNVYFARELLVPTGLIGTIFAVVRLLPFFVSPLLPLAINRWGAGATMAASNALMAAAGLGIAFSGSWAGAGAGFLLASLASGFGTPTRSLFGQESVQPRWRTTVNAVSILSTAAGGSLAWYAGGRLIDQAGFQALFLISAGLALAGAGLYAAGRRRKPAAPVHSQA
jgi:MFS family permease